VLLSAENLTLSFGTRRIFDRLSLRVDSGDRIGLIGDNGTGKTTLLRCLARDMEADDGTVATARRASVGYLKQDPDFEPGNTVLDEAEAAFQELHDLAAQLRRLEHDMADGNDVMAQYDRITHRFEEAGGYAWRHRLEAALDGVGLTRDSWNQQVDRLSGGQRSRLQLAKLLVNRPDVLLLDEPTNHLDLKAIEWLEGELDRYEGAALLVSHDRFLLDRLATRIDHLRRGGVQTYPGNYAAFLKQKEAEELTLERALTKQQKDIEKQAEYVRRFKAGQRARQAKGREKRLNRLLGSDELLQKSKNREAMNVSFSGDLVKSDRILQVKGLQKSFNASTLWNGIGFVVAPGERLGIVGPNGCGKTTLLRCLVGEADADAGEVHWAPKLTIGYYDQRLDDFDPDNSILDELYPVAVEQGLGEARLRDALGAMRFSDDEVFKPINLLSGGERARVALTRLLLRQANVLVLDEPTNHLDVASRDALEMALKQFDGTVISVSHDRYFLDRTSDRLLIFDPPGTVDFRGSWRQWLERRDVQKNQPTSPAKKQSVAKPSTQNTTASRNKYLRPFGYLATAALEERITETEIELSDLQSAFAVGPTDASEARERSATMERLSKELQQLEEEYFTRDDA
jgi:ATP-binding cassette subfamily F protein 3